MRSARRCGRLTALSLLIAVGLLFVLPAAAAWATDEPPEPAAAPKAAPPAAKGKDAAPEDTEPKKASEEEEGPPAATEDAEAAGSMASLESRLLANPSAQIAFGVARFLPILIGLLLLVLWYLKRDKIKAGVLPPPAPAEPTLLYRPAVAYGLALGGMYLIPALVGSIMAMVSGVKAVDLAVWQKMLASALGSVPAAGIVILRRRHLGHVTASERATLLGVEAPAPTPPPRIGSALLKGSWLFCVVAVFITPISLLWVAILQLFGDTPKTQDLVNRVVETSSGSEPWVILIFGVLVAPFVEECIFRGLLYPATKRAFGGGRGAAWKAAILVSVLFACIHLNWLALVPLFVLAMFLTWIVETTNSLAAAVFAHAIHNATSLVPLLVLRYTE